MLPAGSLTIRSARPCDIPALLALNNAAVPAVNELTADELAALIASAAHCLVAEAEAGPAGFLLCLAKGQDYASRNYLWLSRARRRFAYTDRICIDASARCQGIGEALYRALFDAERGSGRSFVCEVNERPANPGSLRFHQRLGFAEIGRLDHGDKAVVYLERTND